MSDVTLLRKLTGKSTLKFGKYSDVPIQQMIDLRLTIYLRWVYFNSSKITFVDEILDAIGIPEDFRIEKPGTNSEKHDELQLLKMEKMHGMDKLKTESKRRKYLKQELKKRIKLVQTELIKAEAAEYDKFFDKKERETIEIYNVVETCVKEIASLGLHHLEAMTEIVKAYKKDPKSIQGIVNKINRQ